VPTGTSKAADNFFDGAGPLEFRDKCLQGIIVFGSYHIFEDLIELRLHPRERPGRALTHVAVGITEGAQQDPDLADVFDLSKRNYCSQTNKPFWIGSQCVERRQCIGGVGIAEFTHRPRCT
jgi:hypothetical protein